MAAAEQEYDEINLAIKFFQDSMMKLRYSNIPVIASSSRTYFRRRL